MKSLLLATVALATVFATPSKAAILGNDPIDWNLAGATPLSLTPTAPGQQVTNLPCLICGANQPQQPTGFGYNDFKNTGNATTISFFSTAQVGGSLAIDELGTGYSILPGSPLRTALGSNLTFSVGLDVNDTGTPQTLESFWFLDLTTHQVLGVFSPEPGGVLVPSLSNGTGFPDYTISGLSLANVNAGDQIIFFARITGANDGPDSFFLIPNAVAETPLPPAVALMGSVLAGGIGIGAIRNRRRKRA
jgi:hypothetical protein